MSYSCKNSQESPFLHNPRNQCLQTIVLSPLTCLKIIKKLEFNVKNSRISIFTWMDSLCLSYTNCGHKSHKRPLRTCPYPERARARLQVGLWVHLPMQKWCELPVPLIHSFFTAKFDICLCFDSVPRFFHVALDKQ